MVLIEYIQSMIRRISLEFLSLLIVEFTLTEVAHMCNDIVMEIWTFPDAFYLWSVWKIKNREDTEGHLANCFKRSNPRVSVSKHKCIFTYSLLEYIVLSFLKLYLPLQILFCTINYQLIKLKQNKKYNKKQEMFSLVLCRKPQCIFLVYMWV